MNRDIILTKDELDALRAHMLKINANKKGVIDAIKQYFPAWVDEIKENAEFAYKDLVRLPGSADKSFIGNPPNWLEKRYDDKEYLWQMNRMNHWIWLIYQYAITKDEKYIKKVFDELKNWTETVIIDDSTFNQPLSYFSECNPLRVLELGIRLYKTWPLIVEYASDSQSLTDEVLQIFANSVYKQASLIRLVSPQVWPDADHNHFVMEMLGLLTTALYFPVFKESEEWKTFAIAQIERAARAQLTNEGGQVEGCPMYHDGCMWWFGMPLVFAREFNFKLSDEYMSRYEKGYKYTLHSLRPTGTSVPVGDSHSAERSVITALYQMSIFDDPSLMEAFFVYMNRKNLFDVVKEFIFRVWQPEKVLRKLVTLEGKVPTCDTDFYNSFLNQAMLRTSWDKNALSVHMICNTPVYNSHAHIDANTIDFTAYGKVIVSDPSHYCYRECAERRFTKSTLAHSTVVIDDRNQFEYIRSFQYGEMKEGKLLGLTEGEFFKGTTGRHKNYEPVVHTRHIALLEDKFLVVYDLLTDCNENKVTRSFHLDYTSATIEKNCVVANSPIASTLIFTSDYDSIRLENGFLSNYNDISRPSLQLRFDSKKTGTCSFLTVLAPFNDEHKRLEKFEIKQNSLNEYELKLDDVTYCFKDLGDSFTITK